MKIKFIVKPPVKTAYRKEFLNFKKEFKGELEEEFTEREGSKNARVLVREAVKKGFSRVVLAGGDGTLNEGINGLLGENPGKLPPDFAIGIIPVGSANNFAKEIGIPKDIKKAFEIIKKGKPTPVDAGKVNDKYFANVVSFGFDARVNTIANIVKDKYQFLPREMSYLLAALKEIAVNLPHYDVELNVPQQNLIFKEKVVLVAVTNSQSYGGIFKINPGADLRDGMLNICKIQALGRLRALTDITRVIKGTHTTLPEVKILKAPLLTISSPEFLPFEIDGEVLKPEKEYQVRVLPGALKVLLT